MAYEIAGVVREIDVQNEVRNDISFFVQRYYPNQYPLIARTTRKAVSTPIYDIRHSKIRPRLFPFSSALNGTDATSTLTMAPTVVQDGVQYGDTTALMPGDVLEIVSGGVAERIQVLATPAYENATRPNFATPAAGTVTVRRGVEGTTVATHATTDGPMLLIGNARFGDERFQPGLRSTPISVQQYNQTWLFPAQVTYGAQSTDVLGVPDLFNQTKGGQLDNMARDMEVSSLYGIGESPYVNGNAKQKGVRQQIVTNRKQASSPGSYVPKSLIADALNPIYLLGGTVDFMMVSVDVLTGIDGWGSGNLRLESGTDVLGLKIDAFQSSVAPRAAIIPNIYLKPGTIFGGDSSQLFWRNKQNEQWQDRGITGLIKEGEWFAEGSIEVQDQERMFWIEGITNFGTP